MNEEISRRVHHASNVDLLELPRTADEFEPWVVERHRFLFGGLLPSIAGRLRTEAVEFGSSRHLREGSLPSEISKELKGVFEAYEAARGRTVSAQIAVFLQRFFEVHPFEDGNGRVARLFAARLAMDRGYVFTHNRSTDSREYVKALERAHMWLAKRSALREQRMPGEECPRNPLDKLEEYIDSVLVNAALDSSDEEPPPDMGVDR